MVDFALWPFEYQASFESGGLGDFDTAVQEAFGGSAAVVHYTELAAKGFTPHSGAYAGRAEFFGHTSSATALFIDGSTGIANGTTDRFMFRFFIGGDLTWTAADVINIFELTVTAAATHAVFGISLSSDLDTITAGVGATAPTVFGDPIKKGVWYTVSLLADVDTGAGSGTISAWISEENRQDTNETVGQGTPYATLVDNIVLNLAPDEFGIGALGVLATTSGTFLFDEIIKVAGDLVFAHPRPPFGRTRWMGKSGHLFVGPGKVCDVTMQVGDAGTTNYIELWDTDRADVTDYSRMKARISSNAPNESVNLPSVPIKFNRGCYVVMSPYAPDADDPTAIFTAEPVYDTRATRLRWARSAGLPGV